MHCENTTTTTINHDDDDDVINNHFTGTIRYSRFTCAQKLTRWPA